MDNKIMPKIISGILLGTIITYTTPIFAYTKDETIYSKLDSNGNRYNTIVSNHIKNEEQDKLINDITDLVNIKNVNGDENFSKNDNNLVWEANGNDIYYQGESKKELPIECNIKYELNGIETKPEELVSKSGRVKIIIEYINKDEHIEKINGKNRKLFTPFVVVSGTIIDNMQNKNISVTNGKIIDNGKKTTVVGISFPGMKENLDNKVEISNRIEIEMDTEKFELENIVSYVTPKLMQEIDFENFGNIDEIYQKTKILKDSGDKLQDGANSLKQGLVTYTQKTKEFNNAIKKVTNGIDSVNKNYSKINNGIVEVSENSGKLKTGAKSINDGVKAIYDNLNIINTKFDDIQNGTIGLKDGQKEIELGFQKIIGELEKIEIPDNSQKIKELEILISMNEKTLKTLKDTNIKLESEIANIKDEVMLQNIKTQIMSNNELIFVMKTNINADKQILSELKNMNINDISLLKDGINKLYNGFEELIKGTEELEKGEKIFKQAINLLAQKTGELSQGSNELYLGTEKLFTGTNVLKNGSSQMEKGLNTLENGTNSITEATQKLENGSTDISNGASELSNGINDFNKKGINEIYEFINCDVKDLDLRIQKMQELAKNYNNFTMIENGIKGNTEFIMIMDNIKEKEDSKQEIIIDEKSSKNE